MIVINNTRLPRLRHVTTENHDKQLNAIQVYDNLSYVTPFHAMHECLQYIHKFHNNSHFVLSLILLSEGTTIS